MITSTGFLFWINKSAHHFSFRLHITTERTIPTPTIATTATTPFIINCLTEPIQAWNSSNRWPSFFIFRFWYHSMQFFFQSIVKMTDISKFLFNILKCYKINCSAFLLCWRFCIRKIRCKIMTIFFLCLHVQTIAWVNHT